MPVVIMPIGKDLGPFYEMDSEDPNRDPTKYQVGLGREMSSLTLAEYKVWKTPFAMYQRAGKLELTREVLRDGARAVMGIDDPNPIIAEALQFGLFAEFEIEPDVDKPLTRSGREFLQRFRLIPTGDAFGNDPARPGLYLIGRERPQFPVDGDAFALWSGSYAVGSMWDGCVDLGTGTGPDDPALSSPEEAGSALLLFLPGIVTLGLGYLDMPA